MKGSCLCGKCVFDLKGEIDAVGKCHCSKCRKVSGTGSNAVHSAKPENLAWLSGEASVKTYVMPDGWCSTFCNDCGSPLPMLIENGTLWIVPAGLLDEDPGVKIKGHIWTGDRPSWDVIDDTAVQFLQGPPGTD